MKTTVMKKQTWIVLLLTWFLAVGCQQRVEFKITFHKNNVLLPAIEFTTQDDAEVFIEYWPTENVQRIQRSKTSKGKEHRIVLLNLKPATTYQCRVLNKTTDSEIDGFALQTGELPAAVTHTNKQKIDTTLFKGFILIRRLAPRGVDVILDNEGDVVWYNLYDTIVRRPFVFTDKRSVLSIYDSSQIVEYDLYGNNLLNMKLEDHGIFNMIHHDAVFDRKGDIVSLTHDSVKMDLRKFGYPGEKFVRADGIVVVSTAGKKIWEWNLLSVYNPLDHPEKKINLRQSLGHANSLTIDKDGHYIVSFRDFSQLWKINSVDGSVMWKLGKDGDFKMDENGYFLRQHAVTINKLGQLMVFDNGERGIRPNSRVLSFKLNEQTMEAAIETNVVLPLDLSADKMCSAELIDDGMYLVCTSKRSGIISVVNDKAEVLWRVDLTSPSYRAYYLSDPFGQQ